MDVVSAACISAVIRRVCMHVCVFVRVQVRLPGSVPLPWQQLLGKCVFGAHVFASFEDQLGFQRDCACVCALVCQT